MLKINKATPTLQKFDIQQIVVQKTILTSLKIIKNTSVELMNYCK